jgi:hypothetical protein
MSYLDIPRIHFAGTFVTDPSTVDNTPSNYSSVTTPEWNPNGTHHFTFENCTVRSAFDSSGKAAAGDPVVGGTVETTNDPRAAKLVDLDTECQLHSQIIGAEIKISPKTGGGFLKGKLQRPTMRSLWFGRAGPGMDGAAGVFQSALGPISFDKLSSSPVLDALSKSGEAISIKFVLYAYNPTSGSPGFTKGKVVGSMGPFGQADGEDVTADLGVHFLHARRMADPGATAAFFAPFKLNPGKKKLTIDLGNCVRESSPAGPRTALGDLQALLVVLPAPATPVVLGKLVYSQGHYETTAGIEELTLTAAQVTQLKTNPLGLFSTKLKSLLVSERPKGLYVDVSEVTLRLNPGESQSVQLVATEFGAPKSGLTLNLKQIGNPEAGGAVAAPASGISFPASVTTSSLGSASAAFTASDPGNPRGPIDGQVYCIGIFSGPAAASTQEAIITIKVFDAHKIPASPAWADVQSIFAEYANLYPSMKAMINLGDQAAVKAMLPRVLATISLDEDDPAYMPVSRDLSRDKKNLIKKWILNGAP